MNLLLRPIRVYPPQSAGKRRRRAQVRREPTRTPPAPPPLAINGRIDGRTISVGIVYGIAVETPPDDDLLIFDLL